MAESINKIIAIPASVKVSLDGNNLKIKGPEGEAEKKFNYPHIKIKISENNILIESNKKTRKFKKIINTFSAHIKNLIKGVTNHHIYKLKICSGHFPMKVTHEQDKIIISNFLGEKIPRKAKILAGVNVTVDHNFIILKGTNKEDTAQSAANIEVATKIKKRDRRIFQDGIYKISGE